MEQSHIDEMRAAIRGDRERAQARREAEQETHEPAPDGEGEVSPGEQEPTLVGRLLFWRT
jgi:hypothetical protein